MEPGWFSHWPYVHWLWVPVGGLLRYWGDRPEDDDDC